MLTHDQIENARAETVRRLEAAGIPISAAERDAIEVSDFGLSDLEHTGLQLIVYVSTDRVCAKELVLMPGQTCPEHSHVDQDGQRGKEETFRVRAGTVYLYVDGDPTREPACLPPESQRDTYKARHEIVLKPGDQYTIFPNTRHWFQAGPEGAIVTEFSTANTDDADVFSDPAIVRKTKLVS